MLPTNPSLLENYFSQLMIIRTLSKNRNYNFLCVLREAASRMICQKIECLIITANGGLDTQKPQQIRPYLSHLAKGPRRSIWHCHQYQTRIFKLVLNHIRDQRAKEDSPPRPLSEKKSPNQDLLRLMMSTIVANMQRRVQICHNRPCLQV